MHMLNFKDYERNMILITKNISCKQPFMTSADESFRIFENLLR